MREQMVDGDIAIRFLVGLGLVAVDVLQTPIRHLRLSMQQRKQKNKS